MNSKMVPLNDFQKLIAQAICVRLKNDRQSLAAIHDHMLDFVTDHKDIPDAAVGALIDEMPYQMLLYIEMHGASDTEVGDRIYEQLEQHGLPPSVTALLTDKKVSQ